jgi:dolichyl-phosphate beta-glucosyltransferase
MSTHAPQLSVVIPAYNEALRIAPTLAQVVSHLEERLPGRWEVVVVDDGSRDATRDVVAGYAAQHSSIRLLALARNRGKGAAVRAGVLAARGAEILFSDADLSTPIEEVHALRAALDRGADVAIGSRLAAGDAVRTQPLLRRAMGRIFRLAVTLLGYRALAALRDTQCGFKLFRAPVARTLFAALRIDGFAFDVELLEAACARYRVAEVAVAWTHVAGSKVSPALDGIRMLRDLARLRLAVRRDVTSDQGTIWGNVEQ